MDKGSVGTVLAKAKKDEKILKQVVKDLSSALNILEFLDIPAYNKIVEKLLKNWDELIQ